MIVPSPLKDLIKELILTALDNETGIPDKIYELVDEINLKVLEYADEIYQKADKETDKHFNKIEVDLKPAAKVYMLVSIVFKESAGLIADKDVSWTLIDAGLASQRQAKQTLQDEVRFYEKRAFKYEQGMYAWVRTIKATEMKNKAKALEYQIKIGSLNKLEKEVMTEYKSIYDYAFNEFEKRSFHKGLKQPHQPRKGSETKEFPVVPESHVTPSQITVKNEYVHSDAIKGEYDWWVYLDIDSNVKEQIDRVIYTLHPTFPRAVRTVNDPSDGFRLNATGWSEFQIKVDIYLKDGETITMYHWLDLGINKNRDTYMEMCLPDAFTGG